MTLSEQYMALHYSEARALFGPILPATPTWGEDLLPGSANAEAGLQNDKPFFAWRSDYPSIAMDPALRASEIKRTARHEIGHPFEFLLARAFQKKNTSTYEEGLAYVRSSYFAFREFSGDWATWEAGGRQPREGFADCFGAALGGEWLIALGSSQADRHLYDGKPVSWQNAREFFLAITEEALGGTTAMKDCAFAEWLPSPNFGGGPNSAQFITDHWTVTWSFETALYVLSLRNGPASVSSHYLIGRDGRIGQLVAETSRAWHNGSLEWNAKAIGIEHVHMPGEDWPLVQLEASERLHADISRRRGIPLDRTRVVGHGETFPTACPGDLPIDSLLEGYVYTEADRQRDTAAAAKVAAIETKLNAFSENLPKVWLRRMFWGFDPFTKVKATNPTTSAPPADLA